METGAAQKGTQGEKQKTGYYYPMKTNATNQYSILFRAIVAINFIYEW